MSGDDVARWERFLVRTKHLDGAPRGFFGPRVATATEAFQEANSLAPTGRADAPTLAAAISQGLLDRSLDEPCTPASAETAKESRWIGMGTIGVAIAAAVGTFLTSVVVELLKHRASIEAEREKLRSALIQQALNVERWSERQAQLEVVNRLSAYARLRLIELPDEVLDSLLRDLSSVPFFATSRPGSPAPANSTPYIQEVFVRFAGSIKREEIIQMVRALSATWRIKGAGVDPSDTQTSGERGGERTITVYGQNAVLYGDDSDRSAAENLAEAVMRTRIVSVQVVTSQDAAIPKGTLEIRVSRP